VLPDRRDVPRTTESAPPSRTALPTREAEAIATEISSVEEVLRLGAVRSVFQPIVDLDTQEVVAFEALARGPVGPLHSPGELFAAARRTGNLAKLDRLCRAAAFSGAIELGLRDPQMLFVNVEPEVLDHAPMDELLALAHSAPGELRVVLEITERALAARPAELLRTVQRIREVGWGVALDDVGAHPASLTFMPLLRPDVIKLDLSLVQRRPSPAIAQIMNAVNAHSEATGAVILAEGIESDEHVDIARALGARLGQGWLFGRPAPDLRTAHPIGSIALPDREHSPVPVGASPFDLLPGQTPRRISTKPLLVQISKQLEREAIQLGDTCLVAATFQNARHFTSGTMTRYADLAKAVGFVGVLGEDLPREPLENVRGGQITADDKIVDEWDLVVLSPHFNAALLARDLGVAGPDRDRRFEYVLTYQREIVVQAALSLLDRIMGPAK
jgi:EAL domain-containing protein (putative c-di-GMP-specific phosphodiesterase class I)